MFGGNLPQCDEFTINLISNEEVIAVNQNELNPHQILKNKQTAIWKSVNPDKSINLAIFNLENNKANLAFDLIELGMSNSKIYTIRDLWDKNDMGQLKDVLSCEIEPHGARLFRICKKTAKN
jgi:alpha-galactosidase